MSTFEIIMILMFIVVHVELLIEKHKITFKKFRKNRKQEIIKSLAVKQREEEIIVEKDKEISAIDDYINYVKEVIDRYNRSRSKRISLKTRQTLLIKTINIIPIASKHIQLNYYYNLDDRAWYKLTDKDMMKLLESAYDDYTHENLDSLNTIFSAALRLRDDKR